MFTGLVEATGTVAGVEETVQGRRLTIRTALADALAPGDSVSVDGVCLTVTERGAGEVAADVGPETARITTLGGARPGRRVNLERAARADTRLGGHLVQGHVDGTTRVDRLTQEGDAHWLGVELPDDLAHLVVPKGSIAVNGVSLTVARLEPGRFDVMIIPYTWAHTTLSDLQVGDAINLECDMVGKYVARAVEGFRNRW